MRMLKLMTSLMTFALLQRCSASNDYIVIAGGASGGALSKTAEALDPNSGELINLPDLPTPNEGVAMAYANGLTYAIGGNNNASEVLLYRPGLSHWDQSDSLTRAKQQGSTAVTINGNIFVVGGYSDSQGLQILQRGIPIWSTGPNSALQHYYSGGAAYQTDFYVCGAATGPTSSCEKFETITKAWSSAPSMLAKRFYFGMTTMNGLIYAVGGAEGFTERFNPVTQVWSKLAPMKYTRILHAVSNDGKVVYAIGGSNLAVSVTYDSIETYNPALGDEWLLTPFKLSTKRHPISAAFVPAASVGIVDNERKEATKNQTHLSFKRDQ